MNTEAHCGRVLGIGVVTNKTDCDVPVTSHAAAYPAALIVKSIAAQLMIRILTGAQ